MFAMGGVPVAAVEDADDIVADGGKRLEEPDESMFIVDLEMPWINILSVDCSGLS